MDFQQEICKDNYVSLSSVGFLKSSFGSIILLIIPHKPALNMNEKNPNHCIGEVLVSETVPVYTKISVIFSFFPFDIKTHSQKREETNEKTQILFYGEKNNASHPA